MQELNISDFNNGSQKEYRRIFDAYYQTMCLFSARFVENTEVSEDCVQEAYIALWNNRGNMESVSHVKAFLYRVCRNKALNYLKHEQIKSRYIFGCSDELESQACFMNFVIEEETEHIIRLTEQNLPPKCLEIFRYSMQGKDNKEIARLLGVSENTVKTQKQIAYKRLRKHVEQTRMLLAMIGCI